MLCPKCGHSSDEHCLEVEAVSHNIEKHNETTSALQCRVWENGTYCGCRYITAARPATTLAL